MIEPMGSAEARGSDGTHGEVLRPGGVMEPIGKSSGQGGGDGAYGEMLRPRGVMEPTGKCSS